MNRRQQYGQQPCDKAVTNVTIMIVVLCCKKLPHPCDANDAELGTKSAKELPKPVCLSETYVLK